ncbi:hypothetical protein QM012_007349 [Aureobasidium pullulans]|uniref:F-box domain-containing protein n=1 Tax=Aureobasidium pullulans TaxID=5580 RepID=A0ABR0TNI5_AURPU
MVPLFTALSAEIRSLVYDILLQDTLSSNERLIYYGSCPKPQACNLPTGKLYVHLADFSNLLRLAVTCKLLRSEILIIVWSNANIFIKFDDLARIMTHIFDDCRSTKCCHFFRTLQIDLPRLPKEPDDIREIVKLIHRRLPQLEELTLSLYADKFRMSTPLAQATMSIVASISSRISIRFRNHDLRDKLLEPQHYTTKLAVVCEHVDKKDKEHPENVVSKLQKRRQRRIEKKRKLEGSGDTIDTGSATSNTQLSRTNTQQGLENEDALEVTRRLRSLMIE